MVLELLFHLSLTLLVEMTIYGLMDSFKLKSFIALSAANITLNLAMNILAMFMKTYQAYINFLAIAEVSVFIIEACVLYLFSNKPIWYCFLASLAANSTSLALGIVANHLELLNKNGMAIAITVINFVIYFFLAAISALVFSSPRLLNKDDNGGDNPADSEEHSEEH